MKKYLTGLLLLSILVTSTGCTSSQNEANTTKVETTATEKEAIQDPLTHLIELEGTYNTRDLGGYINLDGEEIKTNVFIRSDSLSDITSSDSDKLVALGLDAVIDFRKAGEFGLETNVNLPETIIYTNIPISAESKEFDGFYDTFVYMLEENKDQVKLIFETLADDQYETILINCTAGKDRTGLVSILLLGVANVDEDTIANDYALSETLTDPIFDRAEEMGIELQAFTRESKANTAKEVLDYLNDQYGTSDHSGVEGYLKSAGVSDEIIIKLREKMFD